MKDRYEPYCFRFDTKDFFPGTWEKRTPTEQSEWKKKRAAFEKRRGQKRTRRRRRMSGDAILVTLAAAMAIPTLVLSQMAIWESERILAEGIPEPPPRTAYVVEVPASAAEATFRLAEPTPAPAPTVNERYAEITMSDEERRELLAVIYLEAANQSAEGQQAVAEVVLNRVISTDFPDTVHEVIHQDNPVQFSTAENIGIATPTEAQEAALDAALYGESILPTDVVFFSRKGENSRVYSTIGDHVFCYGYEW